MSIQPLATKTITLDGITYYLIPVEVEEEKEVLPDYVADKPKDLGEEGLEEAKPTLYEYRERFKRHELTFNDVQAHGQRKFVKAPDLLEREDGTWYGPGIEVDF